MSDNITKRVGLGTAYGFAKAGGYEGTVEEFTELLGNIAIDLARIENLSVTVTTLPAGSQATASLNGSVLSLGIPKGDKGDKGNTGETGAPAGFGTVSATVDDNIGTPSVEVTASGADTAKNFAFAFHNLKGQKGDKGDTGEVSEAELAQAFADFSENGTVANAEQLTTDIKANDQSPYLFRTSGGSVDIGDREYINGIVGGTVAWNQLAPEADFSTHSHWWKGNGCDSVTFSNGIATVVTLQDPAPATIYNRLIDCDGIRYVKDHAYLACYEYKLNAQIPSGIVPRATIQTYMPMFTTQGKDVTSNNWETFARVFKATESSGTSSVLTRFRIDMGASYTDSYEYQLRRPQVFDLTQMFGSTIADYIYSLEQANEGAGVAWFKKLFPKPYYAYNAGELKSVSGLVSHDMTGFNQLNPHADKINGNYNQSVGATLPSGSPAATVSGENPVTVSVNAEWNSVTFISDELVANSAYKAEYKFRAPSLGNIRATAYIIDDEYTVVEKVRLIQGSTGVQIVDAFTPTKSGLKFALYIASTTAQTIAIDNFCVHLVWDGSRDGEYEPYVKHSYPLDSDLTLRGIPKLDANNNLYYDGDVYEPDGTVTRKYGIVDLGTLTWSYETVSATPRFYAGNLPEKSANKGYWLVNSLISNSYERSYNIGQSAGQDKMYGVVSNSKSVYVVDSAYTDATAFKTAMNGIYLVYELAEPTEETADPYNGTQIVDDFGTEEFVLSDSVFPVPVGHNTDYPINLKAKVEMMPNSPSGDGDYIVRQTNGVNEYVSIANNATIQDILTRLEALEG